MNPRSRAVLKTLICLLVVSTGAFAQESDQLEKVLHVMDTNATNFRNAEADFVWTPYNGVVNEAQPPDKGKIYFRRSGNEIQMAANIQPPQAKQIIFGGGKIQVYQVKSGVVDVYDASAHKEEVEAFLVLGFGSSGEDLKKTFDVKYIGSEKIGNVNTAKLELVPLASNVKSQFPKIDLWIDPSRGLSLRQELFQQGGDYRLADYSNIQVNQRISPNVFKLKTSGNTRTITH